MDVIWLLLALIWWFTDFKAMSLQYFWSFIQNMAATAATATFPSKAGRKKKVHQQTYSYSPWPLITMTHGHIWPEDGIRQRGWGWVSDSTVSAHLTYTPKRGMVRSECNGFFLCPLLCIFTFLFSRTFSSQCHWQHTFIIHSPWSCPHSLNTNWVEHMCHLIIFPRIFHLYSLFCF